MTVKVQCPSCSRSAIVRELATGFSVRCPNCGTRFKPSAKATVDQNAAETMLPTGAAPPPSVAASTAPAAPAAPSAATPVEGERLGRYELRKRLGQGAFGAVYRAFDVQLQREVALKVPHPGTLGFQPLNQV